MSIHGIRRSSIDFQKVVRRQWHPKQVERIAKIPLTMILNMRVCEFQGVTALLFCDGSVVFVLSCFGRDNGPSMIVLRQLMHPLTSRRAFSF